MLIFISLLFPLTVVSVILIAAYNMFIRKKTVQNHYTPFDYIAGQTSKEFHAEKKNRKAGRMTIQEKGNKKAAGNTLDGLFVYDAERCFSSISSNISAAFSAGLCVMRLTAATAARLRKKPGIISYMPVV